MKKLKKLCVLLYSLFLTVDNAMLASMETENLSISDAQKHVADSIITNLKELFKKTNSFSDLQEKRIALLGLTCGDCSVSAYCAFVVSLIEQLSKEGAIISAYVNKSNMTVVPEFPEQEEIEITTLKALFPDVLFHKCPYEAAKGSDAIIVVSALESFKNLDFKYIASTVKNKIIIDVKNIIDPVVLKDAGFISKEENTSASEKQVSANQDQTLYGSQILNDFSTSGSLTIYGICEFKNLNVEKNLIIKGMLGGKNAKINGYVEIMGIAELHNFFVDNIRAYGPLKLSDSTIKNVEITTLGIDKESLLHFENVTIENLTIDLLSLFESVEIPRITFKNVNIKNVVVKSLKRVDINLESSDVGGKNTNIDNVTFIGAEGHIADATWPANQTIGPKINKIINGQLLVLE